MCQESGELEEVPVTFMEGEHEPSMNRGQRSLGHQNGKDAIEQGLLPDRYRLPRGCERGIVNHT